MTILSDRELQEELKKGSVQITPFDNPHHGDGIQPASIDLRLGNDFIRNIRPKLSTQNKHERYIIDIADEQEYTRVQLEKEIILKPNEFCLGRTLETIKLPPYLVGRLEGRSSVGRDGLLVHATAGFIDPGFEGTITLELYNLNRLPLRIPIGMYLCQLVLELMTSCANKPYGHQDRFSKYQGQIKPTVSKMYNEFRKRL